MRAGCELKRFASGLTLAMAVATTSIHVSHAGSGKTLELGRETPVLTLFCVHADAAITLMGRLVKGESLLPSDFGSSCTVFAERVLVEKVHSRQEDPTGRTWTLASVQLPGERVGYILTTLEVSIGVEV